MRSAISWLPFIQRSLVAVAVSAIFVTPPLWAQLSASTNRTGSIADDLHAEALASQRDGQPARTRHPQGLVSSDTLRHPVSDRVRKLLRRALDAMNIGKHEEAIGQLQETLSRYPNSAPYVHSFLGVEYIKTRHFHEAANSFEQAAVYFPHDATTHYNFGVSLVLVGDLDRAEQEARRALELDPKIQPAQELLHILHQSQ